MSEEGPFLISCKPLKPEYSRIKRIQLNEDNFTIGRGKHCSALIPVVLISRTHCTFRKTSDNEWSIEDNSLCGISVNGSRLGKGVVRKLTHEDIIELDPTQDFMYKFIDPSSDVFEVPRKRIKLEPNDDVIKMKFEESQNYEMKHLEEKLHNTQQQKTTTKILKEQLQLDMNRKIQQLENDFAEQINNLKGEKDEVERQKATLIEERDAQLLIVKEEMEGKITELMDQIKKHNETESELINENNLLKEKLLKEREEFMLELNRATSCKDELLKNLEAKSREQEETRLREKQEWEEQLRKETELLTLAKEQAIKELEELRKQREEALMDELDKMKKNLEAQEQQTAQQRLQAEQQLAEQMEEMKKLSLEDQVKMEQLTREREVIQNMLIEAEINAQKSIEEAKEKVKEREIELAAIAAERIQKEADQSNEVISSLQQQLEKLRDQLQAVEIEKNTLLEALVPDADGAGEGTSKQAALVQVGELVENELQCSICAEQFIAATTLNCSHTFCKYCIAMWKKKKKDCPICRAPITSECRSLVIDSLIETMVLNQPDEVKKRRQDLLKAREENEAHAMSPDDSCGSSSSVEDGDSDEVDDDDDDESSEGEEEESEQEHEDTTFGIGDFFDYVDDDPGFSDFENHIGAFYDPTRRFSSDTDSGPDSPGDAAARAGPGPAAGAAGRAATRAGAEAHGAAATADSLRPATGLPHTTAERSNRRRGGRSSRFVPGVPGSYWGGYGRCFNCNNIGHWAPGCPFR